MTKFEHFLIRKATEYGGKFDQSTLNRSFIGAFNSNERISVEFVNDKGEVYETKRGRIGVTTGWKPVFLLMLTTRSRGSMYTIGSNDRIA